MIQTKTDKHHSLLFRFVTSYSTVLLFVLILGFFFMFSLRSTYRNSTYRQNTTQLENSVKEMDTALRLFSTLTTQIGSNETIKALSYLKESEKNYHFYASGKESMEYLSNLMSMQAMLPVQSFYVYLPETEYFLSPSQFASKEMFYFQRTGLEEAAAQKRDELISSYDNVMLLLPFTDYTSAAEATYLYKIPLSATFSETYRPGIACFELNLSALQAYFREVLNSSSSFLYVTYKTGQHAFTIGNDADFSTKIESLILLADHSSSAYRTEEFTRNGQNFTITKASSSYNGWNYYLIQPSAYLLNDLAAYQTTYLVAIAVVLLISFLIIFSLSRANVKPIQAMKEHLETAHQENSILQEKNEVLQDANLSLLDALNKQRPLVYSAYVARIMKGAVASEQDIHEINDFLKLKGLGSLHFHVLLISLRLEQLDNVNHYQLQEYESLLYRCFYQYFGSDILIYHPDVNNFALLLSDEAATDAPDCIAAIRNTFTELHNYLLSEHSLWVFAGLGDSNTKLPYFWKSYQQALEAVSLLKEDRIFQSYRELSRSNETYYYPYEMAQQLTAFIQAANTTQINEIFKLLHRENMEYRSLSPANVSWLLSDLRTTLIKIVQGLPEKSPALPADFEATLTDETTLNGMLTLALTLSSCFKQTPSGNQLIASIQTYISKNYHDPDLSLKKISEEFSISESYFSYLFKAEAGRNFSEYLEELRMQQAIQLLKKTDIPLSELYHHLGYNNPNSFRRAFKKVYGASPKEFRRNQTED